MPNHTYQPGDLVERVSTGEQLQKWKQLDCDMPTSKPYYESQLVERLRSSCVGHPCAKIPWPHRLLHDAADTIEMNTVELAAKDAEIARLEAQLSHIEEYGTQEINDAIGLRQRIAELEVQVADSAEREAKLRKLCGEAARIGFSHLAGDTISLVCAVPVCAVCGDENCFDDCEMYERLRAAAEGGEV